MRRFTSKLAVATLAIGAGYVAAQMLAPAWRLATSTDAPPAAVAELVASPTPSSVEGDELVLGVLDRLERRPNVAAKVRQTLRHGDQSYSGVGRYWQQYVGNQRRTRWELKTALDDEAAFFTQIYDRDYVWTDRQTPTGRAVTRIDLQRVRRDLGMTPFDQGQGAADATRQELLVRGGMTQVLAELHRNFTFSPPQLVRQGNRESLALVGRWRPEFLAAAWPTAVGGDLGEWPPHLPHHVLLHVTARDLFPHLIEYRGPEDAALAASAAGHRPSRNPLASYVLDDIQFAAPMPEKQFEGFAQSDWRDVTARAMERLQPPPSPEREKTAGRYGDVR